MIVHNVLSWATERKALPVHVRNQSSVLGVLQSICSKLSTWPSKCVRTCLSKSCCWQLRGNCSEQTGHTFQWLSTCCSKLRCSKCGGKITSHRGQRLCTSLADVWGETDQSVGRWAEEKMWTSLWTQMLKTGWDKKTGIKWQKISPEAQKW